MTTYPDDFEALWAAYPRRSGGNNKRSAFRQYTARLREGHTHAEMLAGVERYAEYVRSEGKEWTPYVKLAATFLGRDCHFEDTFMAEGGTLDDIFSKYDSKEVH